jgi:3-oxoacyl-[acyl-carrier-protein] synthase III
MSHTRHTVIAGTGSYIPQRRVGNEDFLATKFFDPEHKPFPQSAAEIVEKFQQITGIRERRWVGDDLVTSDIAALAAEEALTSSGIDRESLDYVVVAHNFGDVRADNRRSDFVPTLASRLKAKLGIENPRAIAYDLPFGCPGWLQGVIQADYFLKSGDADRALVVGAETLSRVSDPHDRDSMLYSDGAGAAILEARPSDQPVGILSHAARTDTSEHAYLLWMGGSWCPEHSNGNLYLKMEGHKVYEYAVRTVPEVVAESLTKAKVTLDQVKKVFIHQANAKMDEAILKRLLRSAGLRTPPAELMPMTVGWLGNSSVATLPTLYDMVVKGQLEGHGVAPGDLVVFASVGAGMNINAVTYRVP